MIGGWLWHLVGYWPLHVLVLALVFALVAAPRWLVLAVAGLELLIVLGWAGVLLARYGSGGIVGHLTGQIAQFAAIAAGIVLAVTALGLWLRRRTA